MIHNPLKLINQKKRPKRYLIKNHHREIRLLTQRIVLAMIIASTLMLCLIARLGYLQIIQHGYYTTLSQKNRLDLIPLAPKRGLIYDRNGKLLAENIPIFNIVAKPSNMGNVEKSISELATLIPLSETEIEAFHKQRRQMRRFEQIPLKMHLSEKEVAIFSVNQWRFPGMMIKPQLLRRYPQGEALAHVIGYVGRINSKELQSIDTSNYSATNFIGKTGIERSYESRLHGQVGFQEVEIDASGRPIRTLKETPSVAGENLYLTIDADFQKAIAKAMGEQQGAVVAIDPQTGEILGFYSNPSFDPNLFVTGIDAKSFKALQESPAHPLYNRALYGQYPMASTIKPFIGLAGLQTGLITKSYQIHDTGGYRVNENSRVYRDWNWRRNGHGWVNITKAITVSCDTFFYALAHRLGIKHISQYLTYFGFGHKTGVDLYGEASGLVPTPQWKRQHRKTPWYIGDTILAGIGQGFILVTPTQLAHATATLAMRGQRYTPHFLKNSQLANGQFVDYHNKAHPPIHLRESAWPTIVHAMQLVISHPRGTGHRFGRDTPYTVAAKTGTAQVISRLENRDNIYHKDLAEHLRDHGLFIAFAPVDHPRIAIAIISEHKEIAAPVIARKVFDYYLLHKKIG